MRKAGTFFYAGMLITSLLFSCTLSYQAQKVQYNDYRISAGAPRDSAMLVLLKPYSDSIAKSMNDVVAQVTGVVVRETVPDRVLDEASEIEVIDLPPDELLNRLHEGKVYVPDQANRAIEKFFRKGNLSALREMSLRRAAERVDTQMRNYMRTRAIQGPWGVAERLLVCRYNMFTN